MWSSWSKRQLETFRLVLGYGEFKRGDDDDTDGASESTVPLPGPAWSHIGTAISGDPDLRCKYWVEFDWTVGEDESNVALKLQSQVMVALPAPEDHVRVRLTETGVMVVTGGEQNTWTFPKIAVKMTVEKRQEPLRVLRIFRTSGTAGGTPFTDGTSVLAKVLPEGTVEAVAHLIIPEGPVGLWTNRISNWRALTTLNLSSCGLTVLPADISTLSRLERLYLDANKLTTLPVELGLLEELRVLKADQNTLISVPIELRQCSKLVELSLEQNKLVRPLLDFRTMRKLQTLRLFGNPLDFLPEILPCTNMRYLSLANVRIEADLDLAMVNVTVETDSSAAAGYFTAARHKLSTFFSLVFRYSSCQHPLLASALAKIADDPDSRGALGRDDGAIRQLLSMILSDNKHVVQQASSALSAISSEADLVSRLIKADVLQCIRSVLRSEQSEIQVPGIRIIASLAFSSDAVAMRVLRSEIFSRLKDLCSSSHAQVQREALVALGNLSFSGDCRRLMAATEGLRAMLFRLATDGDVGDDKSSRELRRVAGRALAILGENELLRRALRDRPVARKGVRILSMDGGGMRGMATVRMLRRLEKGTGKKIFELFDLICGTSTGGMLAVALAVNRYSLDQCEEIYKSLGKVVFSEPGPKDAEAATWREKLDQMYKSGTMNFRVIVHGSKHNSEEFERLLKEMCKYDEGDLLIESGLQGGPKVFVVASLVSVTPVQPFLFRTYQHPPGTPESALATASNPIMLTGAATVSNVTKAGNSLFSTVSTPVGAGKGAFMGSCKHHAWEAIRASSAAPYYLDDFSCDNSRWQDGAVTANNPSLIALREARLLWPDSPIDCLVSFGCGAVPTKPRGKSWRYIDTGQVLIESACSVERVEEALDTLLPMVPDLHYYRFNPVDDRCAMELDETDPTVWNKLESATQEYVENNDEMFDTVCKQLLVPLMEEETVVAAGDEDEDDEFGTKSMRMNSGRDTSTSSNREEISEDDGPFLGWRSKVLVASSSEKGTGKKRQALQRSDSVDTLKKFLKQHKLGVEVHVCERMDCEPKLACVAADDAKSGDRTAARRSTSPSRSSSERLSGAHGDGVRVPHMVAADAQATGSRLSSSPERGDAAPKDGSAAAAVEGTLKGVAAGCTSLSSSLEPGGVVVADKGSATMPVPVRQTSGGVKSKSSPASPPLIPSNALRRHSSSSSPGGLHSSSVHAQLPASPPALSLSRPLSPHAVVMASGLMPSAQKLYERLSCSPLVGILHLDMDCDEDGLIMTWQNDITAVVEPGEEASAFLQAAEPPDDGMLLSLPPSARLGSNSRVHCGDQFASVAAMIAAMPTVQVKGVLHTFAGRHTQVLNEGREVGAYMFERTFPSERLIVDDVCKMVGAFQNRLVVCGRAKCVPRTLIDEFLMSGAKAVIAIVRQEETGPLDLSFRAMAGGLTELLVATKAGSENGRIAKERDDWLSEDGQSDIVVEDAGDAQLRPVNEIFGSVSGSEDEEDNGRPARTPSAAVGAAGAGNPEWMGIQKWKDAADSAHTNTLASNESEEEATDLGPFWHTFYKYILVEKLGIRSALRQALAVCAVPYMYECFSSIQTQSSSS